MIRFSDGKVVSEIEGSRRLKRVVWQPVVLLGMVLIATPAQAVPALFRDTLWIALQGCILMKETTGRTFPCLIVDLGDKARPGTAVMRAPGQHTHIVVMPTKKIRGIESPELQLQLGSVLWLTALANRHVVTGALKGSVPISDIGLAVNAKGGRSQDQLHIHLDCINPIVRSAIHNRTQHIQASWVAFTPDLLGLRLFAMRIKEAEVKSFNPFVALANVPGHQTGLKNVSFAAFSTPKGDPDQGLFIFAYRSLGGHAEKLLDHTCSVHTPTAIR